MEKTESLWKLQDRLLELEDAINCDETELELLIGEIGDKIDNIKYVIDIFEKEAERFKEYRDQMTQRAKSLQNAAERIKAYVIKSLEAHGSKFEKGNVWTVKIRENKRIEMQQDEPTSEDLFKFGMKYPIIKTTYEWDKAKLKELISQENHDSQLDEYARIVTSKSLAFSTINITSKKEK